MPKTRTTVLRRSFRVVYTAVCLAAALACSHAMVGPLRASEPFGDSSSTPVEELRHEGSVSRRAAKPLVHVAKSLPTFTLPVACGRHEASCAAVRSSVLSSLAGGQHALRNGIGAPLLT
jgi:hypothetical protein